MIYIYPQEFPNKRASCVHVLGLCEAFSILEETDLFVLELTANPLNLSQSFGMRELSIRQIFYILGRSDLIITRSIKFAILFSVLGRDTILDIHADTSEWRKLHRILIRRLSPFLAKRLRVSVITRSLRDNVVALFDGYKVKVIPDGAEDLLQKPYLPKNEVELFLQNYKKNSIGYCGSFNPGKGVEIIIDIAANMPEYPFIIVGGRDIDLEKVRNVMSERGIKNILLTGYVPSREVHYYLALMDICLLPNKREVFVNGRKTNIGSHTSPLKLFEYFSMKKAVIASDIEVLKEVLVHQENCLLVNPDDIQSWVQAIEAVSNNKSLAEAIRCTARKQFEIKYSWNIRAKNLKALTIE